MIADLADDRSRRAGAWFLHAVLYLDAKREINNDEGDDCRPCGRLVQQGRCLIHPRSFLPWRDEGN